MRRGSSGAPGACPAARADGAGLPAAARVADLGPHPLGGSSRLRALELLPQPPGLCPRGTVPLSNGRRRNSSEEDALVRANLRGSGFKGKCCPFLSPFLCFSALRSSGEAAALRRLQWGQLRECRPGLAAALRSVSGWAEELGGTLHGNGESFGDDVGVRVS